MQNFNDMQKMNNANTGTTMRSFDAVTKGTQAIAFEIADYSKRSFEQGAKTMESLFGVRSLDKAIEVQSEYAKRAVEDYVAYATKLGELYANLAKEAFNPYEGVAGKMTSEK
jgi:hypothetical protein